MITGNAKGKINLWKGNVAGEDIKAHTGAVIILKVVDDDLIYSGGKNGVIINWGLRNGKLLLM